MPLTVVNQDAPPDAYVAACGDLIAAVSLSTSSPWVNTFTLFDPASDTSQVYSMSALPASMTFGQGSADPAGDSAWFAGFSGSTSGGDSATINHPNGTILYLGGGGGGGGYNAGVGGLGGYGSGGAGATGPNAAGGNAVANTGGGGGGAANISGGPRVGGAGAAGLCIVWYALS